MMHRKFESFLSKHFLRYPSVAFDQQGKWKLIKEYVVQGVKHYDFSNPLVGTVILNEKCEIVAQPIQFPMLKPSLSALSTAFYEIRGDELVGKSIKRTIKSVVSSYTEVNLLGEGDDTDDEGNPGYAYYYECDSRNVTIFFYPDDSWGSDSD